MALTIQTEILNQEATGVFTYCYLYEPLRVVLNESNLSATKFFVDLEVLDTENDTIQIDEILKYAEFDINPGQSFSFDLMSIAQQYHNAGVFKFAANSDILSSGWQASVSKYKYNFKIYTDVSVRQNIKKLPLLGGRMLEQFSPVISASDPVNEFEFYGLDANSIRDNWKNNFKIDVVLVNPTLQNAKPTMSQSTGTGKEVCGGWLIWKSRFSGWMFWGFDLQNKNFRGNYEGNLEVGMFKSTLDVNGQPYVPVNYTGRNSSYTISLKSLGLSSEELLAVAGIHSTPAIYYSEPGSTKLELMRLSSATTPINNLANGGDFSVSLQSISRTGQKTI